LEVTVNPTRGLRFASQALLGVCLTWGLATGRTWEIRVDDSGDAPSVQAGIDSSASGDSVLVHPGTYAEAINFLGKNIVVKSLAGPGTTILDASGLQERVIRFEAGETRDAVVQGFTITGGNGGIVIINAEPSIIDNVITGNGNTASGGGIWAGADAFSIWFPLIQGNTITNNQASNLGGGVGTQQSMVPDILDNYIASNVARDGDGGGIYYRSNDNGAVIRGNTVINNYAGDHGGGIYVWHVGDLGLLEVEVSWNVVIDNVADGLEGTGNSGGGIWLWETNAWVHHNTVVQSSGNGPSNSYGGGVIIEQPGSPVVEYNIIALTKKGGGIWCGGGATPIIRGNLAWQNLPEDGVGDCSDWWQSDGNIVADPHFCDAENGDFTLAEDSPAITHSAGPLGAFATPGCGPVPVKNSTWGLIKSKYVAKP